MKRGHPAPGVCGDSTSSDFEKFPLLLLTGVIELVLELVPSSACYYWHGISVAAALYRRGRYPQLLYYFSRCGRRISQEEEKELVQ